MEAVHLLVSGTVQGVGYRAACRRAAESAGATGWVRNLDDGRVEAVVAGSREAVEAMVVWCHEGPRAAVVDRVEAAPLDAPPPGLADRFEVR
ncbi:acylphosphatase [Citricoccus sp. SGAir0253]|uniref:acylphosphatase n=1 Tax=Citricoccus sp. SGAir0253 TaxID=2567881 RepID=UPI0010CD290E|nr:acylphosphatase [Citricoccus sp. SGAir0253]QCU77641.1 acylphosphatase [Citricoccus sp. SGAir0253]